MNIDSIYFNSRDKACKSPFGAVPCGEDISFTIKAHEGVIKRCRLIVEEKIIKGNYDEVYYVEPIEYTLKKDRYSTEDCKEYWSINIKFNSIGVYAYYFEIECGEDKFYYGNNSNEYSHTIFNWVGTGGEGRLYKKADGMPRFNQTIYVQGFKTPDWAKDAVYYHIFPERFKNGDKSNDPNPKKRGFYGEQYIIFHKDWNEKPCTAQDNEDGICCNDFFGGDIQGIIEKLDYLKELGINAIYLNPIFQASSNHKYDTMDYHKIDEAFGTNELFKEFVGKAKDKGIRVILDISLNHCGLNSIYFDRYGEHDGIGAFKNGIERPESIYHEWFTFDKELKEGYDSWLEVPSLVTLKEVDSYKDFAYRDDNSVTKFWLNMGIAGWRMDVAPWKSDTFWKEWSKEVKKKNSDALTICEVWWDSSKYLLGNQFDSTMNYLFRYALIEYANGGSAKKFINILEMMRENYPKEAFYCLMNLLSSHDVPRALYELGYDESANYWDIALAKERFLLCTFFQMTYPGAPAIYYGDEVGASGGEDPQNRATYPWEEDGGRPDYGLLNEFKILVKLRNDYKVLRRGDIDTVYVDENLVVMIRRLENQYAIIAVNNSQGARSANINISKLDLPELFTNPLDIKNKLNIDGDVLHLKVEGLRGNIYISMRGD